MSQSKFSQASFRRSGDSGGITSAIVTITDIASGDIAVGPNVNFDGPGVSFNLGTQTFTFNDPGDSLCCADWALDTIRYYAVNNQTGSDANLGYSDVSMAAAGAVALKTVEKLQQILPINGAGRNCRVALKRRSDNGVFLAIDGFTPDFWRPVNYVGYDVGRSSLTGNGFAGGLYVAATEDFSDTTFDRIHLGGIAAPSTNVPGYNPSGAPTTFIMDCILAGGGAPGLPAEPGLLGWRIRFDAATTTVALRNVCRNIVLNDTDTIELGRVLPAVPVGTDVFYIEQPGVRLADVKGRGVSAFIGIRSDGDFNAENAIAFQASFISGNALSVKNANEINLLEVYILPFSLSSAPISGTAFRFNTFSIENSEKFTMTCHSTISTTANSFVVNCSRYRVGRGGITLHGYSVVESGRGIASSRRENAAASVIGNEAGAGSATFRRLRVKWSTNLPFGCRGGVISYQGISVEGTFASAENMFSFNGQGCQANFSDVVGSVTNTLSVITMAIALESKILINVGSVDEPVTVVANVAGGGDIAFSDPLWSLNLYTSLANILRLSFTDPHGNYIAGKSSYIAGNSRYFTNGEGATIPAFSVVRLSAANTIVRAAADTLANSNDVLGIIQHSCLSGEGGMVVTGGYALALFAADPPVGLTYLSASAAPTGLAATTPPTGRKVTLGAVVNPIGGATGIAVISLERSLLPDTVKTLTDAATIVGIDASLNSKFGVTLAGNRTMDIPSNPTDGLSITFVIRQDGTGGRTLAWTAGAGGYAFANAASVQGVKLTDFDSLLAATPASGRVRIGFIYDVTANRWDASALAGYLP
jgi:hypothetical protein